MTSGDARSLSADALEALRRRAVAAVEAGVTRAEVARLFGVSRKTVGAWVAEYRRRGDDALRPRRRGRRPGEQFALSAAQQARVVRAIVAGPPEACGLPQRLWTRQAIAELVRREFGILISSPTVSQYLARWGLVEERRLPQVRRGRVPSGRPGEARPGNDWIVGAEVLRLTWTRPHTPVDSRRGPVSGRQNLLTGFRDHFGDVNLLLALSHRGVVFLQAQRGAFDARQADEFLTRLTDQFGRGLNVIVCEWPAQHDDMLREWPRPRPGLLSVRFALD
ncbi:helix-turn-helix domain-containing protein [Actinokineospora sp. PR83]|uniref:helix-turn-helix domain-containing protein n=1 Tax=Actinokineospora sp. PR83 TaxID=2884908 RepID=UPI0027E0D9D4|nr:helix-turn-helix domain-containing protein [Actinokineospora sp. PR83]MCG8914943.1 helix-turn-helix domain-containing protein [Actinokineospora sp. PR83]